LSIIIQTQEKYVASERELQVLERERARSSFSRAGPFVYGVYAASLAATAKFQEPMLQTYSCLESERAAR
jgi:hypothetical protein